MSNIYTEVIGNHIRLKMSGMFQIVTLRVLTANKHLNYILYRNEIVRHDYCAQHMHLYSHQDLWECEDQATFTISLITKKSLLLFRNLAWHFVIRSFLTGLKTSLMEEVKNMAKIRITSKYWKPQIWVQAQSAEQPPSQNVPPPPHPNHEGPTEVEKSKICTHPDK